MSEIAIRAEGLSKRYQIGARRARYRTLRDTLTETLTAPVRRASRLLRGRAHTAADLEQTIWALKDVSFEVRQGEILGVIGANGAGKSTLLKIISRITPPTQGTATVHGRIGSLLEVGTGFHPELTGRENVYFNGAILGMRRHEIARKFDEIVDFADIEPFIDTPVKFYSSGMYVRLAFAVAAYLETEILLVDEVLAVGDQAFQRKSLGKMEEVTSQGRTVLFVSHNMGAVVSLCSRCLLIQKGSLIRDGSAAEVVDYYQSSLSPSPSDTTDLTRVERVGSGKAKFTAMQIQYLAPDGTIQPYLRTGHDMRIDLDIVATARVVNANVALIFYDASGYRLIDANMALKDSYLSLMSGQQAHVRFHLYDVLLKPGIYKLGLWIGYPNEHIDHIYYATTLNVELDLDSVKQPRTFPGPYQCRFDHEVQISDGLNTHSALEGNDRQLRSNEARHEGNLEPGTRSERETSEA